MAASGEKAILHGNARQNSNYKSSKLVQKLNRITNVEN
jgi:hypothetical protein